MFTQCTTDDVAASFLFERRPKDWLSYQRKSFTRQHNVSADYELLIILALLLLEFALVYFCKEPKRC